MMHVKALPLFILLLTMVSTVQANRCHPWPQWDTFRNAFMSDDGRIIDFSTPAQITTSEGQAYALFFALLADDKASFDKLLQWTNNNLSNSQLGQQLPAWQWGKADNGIWKILDKNSASDANLWIAYTLLEAARLWQRDDYQTMGKNLLQQIYQQEVMYLPGVGPTLLPAPYGFNPKPNIWRLNPSYAPIQLLRYFSTQSHHWQPVLNSSLQLIKQTSPRGFSPDWAQYKIGKGFMTDPVSQAKGSYDAIRVYLWAGMLADEDPAKQSLIAQLKAMANHLSSNTHPPETINTATGETNGIGPVGFSAALLPFLAASNNQVALINQLTRLLDQAISTTTNSYYNQVLGLFGLGWQQKIFRFSANGQLLINKDKSCT